MSQLGFMAFYLTNDHELESEIEKLNFFLEKNSKKDFRPDNVYDVYDAVMFVIKHGLKKLGVRLLPLIDAALVKINACLVVLERKRPFSLEEIHLSERKIQDINTMVDDQNRERKWRYWSFRVKIDSFKNYIKNLSDDEHDKMVDDYEDCKRAVKLFKFNRKRMLK